MSNQPSSDTGTTGADSQALLVRVRMYRSGLGDCFLISFFQSGTEHHMLIDCGVYQGTPDSEAIMLDIARHIRKTTSRHIDLVVGTHEHWDHLSGFQQARAIFDQIDMKQVWLAWTEDPTNPLAVQLRRERTLALNTLRVAASLMPASLAAQQTTVNGLLDFFGPSENTATETLSSAPQETGKVSGARQALDYLAGRADALVSYCTPGEPPRTLEGLPGVRFFVFGPPTSEKLLKKTKPGKKAQETYGLTEAVDMTGSFFAAIQQLQASAPISSAQLQDYPFDPRFQVTREHASHDPFFIEHYGFDGAEDDKNAWRRIDQDWLSVTSELALNLDSATNNTSLVLAIELVESGQVLLFPGDAQVGNWLSWNELSWDIPLPDGATKTIRAADLLSRTVLYKVGHHGSHNATLREQGLERMQSQQMVGMLPVQREMAERQNWSMPFPALYQRLQEKTRGRMIRLDDGLPEAAPPAENGLPLSTQAEWKAFKRKTSEQRLYLDYFIG